MRYSAAVLKLQAFFPARSWSLTVRCSDFGQPCCCVRHSSHGHAQGEGSAAEPRKPGSDRILVIIATGTSSLGVPGIPRCTSAIDSQCRYGIDCISFDGNLFPSRTGPNFTPLLISCQVVVRESGRVSRQQETAQHCSAGVPLRDDAGQAIIPTESMSLFDHETTRYRTNVTWMGLSFKSMAWNMLSSGV